MLPHEAAAQIEIAALLQPYLDRMTALHDAVVSLLTAGKWTIGKPGIHEVTIRTIAILLTKACKTFRAIQILLERGLVEDANVLVRSLLETTVAGLFILQKKSKVRTQIYYAHGLSQDLKMLHEWRRTKGLKRKAPKALVEQMTDAMMKHVKRLPPGTDYKGHWSGEGSLQNALKAIHAEALYAVVYRMLSPSAHATDAGRHVEADEALEELVYQIVPRPDGAMGASFISRELLWMLANRINERLGLGVDAVLAPHKLTKAELPPPE